MHTEEYRVTAATFSPPGPIPPTTQITMTVVQTNAPATPITQMNVVRLSAQTGTGFEYEQTNPPPPPTVTLYGQVNFEPTKFDTLRTNLKNPKCKVNLTYQSQVQNGNDPINSFEPIYTFA